MNFWIVYFILGAVAVFLYLREGRRFQREAARDLLDRTRRRYPLCVTQEDADAEWDRLADAIRDTRDLPHESCAWGPDADQPVPYLPAEISDLALWEAEYARYKAARLRQEGSQQ